MKTNAAACALGVVLALTGAATATTVTIATPSDSYMINGAIFEGYGARTAGTGNINPFLRLNGNGPVVEGYNTSVNSGLPPDVDHSQTNSLLLAACDWAVINGIVYREFRLDINEPNNQNSQVSLDRVQIYTNTVGNLNPGLANVSSLGTLRFDMDVGVDGPSTVILDETSTGSGQFDMRLWVPNSLFAGLDPFTTFIYMYCRMGDSPAEHGGFEEWATRTPDTQPVVIPLPGAAMATLAGLTLVAGRRRRS